MLRDKIQNQQLIGKNGSTGANSSQMASASAVMLNNRSDQESAESEATKKAKSKSTHLPKTSARKGMLNFFGQAQRNYFGQTDTASNTSPFAKFQNDVVAE